MSIRMQFEEVQSSIEAINSSIDEGNLRQKTLKEIWENPDGFSYNCKFKKTLLTGKCQNCEKGPFCAGGCRSYNFFVHGKMYEAPMCVRVYQ